MDRAGPTGVVPVIPDGDRRRLLTAEEVGEWCGGVCASRVYAWVRLGVSVRVPGHRAKVRVKLRAEQLPRGMRFPVEVVERFLKELQEAKAGKLTAEGAEFAEMREEDTGGLRIPAPHELGQYPAPRKRRPRVSEIRGHPEGLTPEQPGRMLDRRTPGLPQATA